MKKNTECGGWPQLDLVELEAVTGGRPVAGQRQRVYKKQRRGKGSGKSSN